jgi:hypothetical protein
MSSVQARFTSTRSFAAIARPLMRIGASSDTTYASRPGSTACSRVISAATTQLEMCPTHENFIRTIAASGGNILVADYSSGIWMLNGATGEVLWHQGYCGSLLRPRATS